jgi:glycosyltransferase involved in cell wall biosynthesis
MRSVFILQPKIPHYRLPFFAELKKLGLDSDIEYIIGVDTYTKENVSDRDFSYPQILPLFAKRYKLGGRTILKQNIPSNLLKSDLIIVEYALRNLLVYKWAFFGGVKRLAFWGHGKTYTKSNSKLEEWAKTKLGNRSDWFFGYTKKGVDVVVEKGFQEIRTTVVQNSTDTNQLKEMIRSLSPKSVQNFKSQHNIGAGPVGVFVGELEFSKRLDFLIAAAVEIHNQSADFELLIFGSGPELKNVLASCEEFPFIKYCGRADQNTQALISKVAKLIMMPGRVGLIAVDSFALGLPIVTTKWPWHAPEFEYLSHGRNSVICQDSLEDYSLAVINLIHDESRLNELRNNCLQDSEKYTIESMAINFHGGVLNVLGEVRPRKS